MFLLKNTVGTVNFLDWLHVTCSKVSAPGVIVWEHWFDAPVSNLNFTIPVADATNYYVRFYDAPNDVSLGTIHLELIVNALTGKTMYERRWYLVGGAGDHDPIDGSTMLSDPYLIGKNVTGLFKEGFRYLKETDEFLFNDITGEVSVINGTQWANDERIMIEIKYTLAEAETSTSNGLYTTTIEVPELTRTLTVDEVDARVVLTGMGLTQKILLPSLSAMPENGGYYFDNTVKGGTLQPVIVCDGTDKIEFSGFDLPSNLFPEMWVSKGEHLLIRKRATRWEVILDYKGTNVGEKVTVGYKGHPNILTENGQLIDGEEYPRLWWWINNVLPPNHKYTTDTVTNIIFMPTQNKRGQFAIHSTLKKFRMPMTVGLMEKGLSDFETYGADSANRPIDYPGGIQEQQLMKHGHNVFGDSSGSSGGVPYALNKIDVSITGAQRAGAYLLSNLSGEKLIQETGGDENRVTNVGVIYGRRI